MPVLRPGESGGHRIGQTAASKAAPRLTSAYRPRMEFATAAMLLDVITAVAAVVWFAGAVFVWRTARTMREPVNGELEVDAAPATLVRRAKSLLARGLDRSPLSGITLLEAHPDAVVWEGGEGRMRHTGSLRVAATSGSERSRVAWQLETRTALVTVGHWLVALAGLAIIGLHQLLLHVVLAAEDPWVRPQVLQMLQVVHFLWPPFLLAGLARATRTRLVRDLERSLRNAALADDE